jgi:hypothetical protein
MITVVNIRGKGRFRHNGTHYAGRPGPLGNPFIVGEHGERGECVEMYKDWFFSDLGKEHREYAARLPDDAVLECWCVPNACHAQFIADYENKRRGLVK